LLILTLGTLLLTACGGSGTDTSAAVLTEAALIYSQSLTETAAVAPPTATNTVPPTATNTVALPTNTPSVTGTPPTNTPAPTDQPASGGNTSSGSGCYRAELTYETIPDGTQVEVTENFKKRWVFKNIGTCTWSQDFSIIWVQDELFGANSAYGFADFTDAETPPGEHIDISIPFVAPNQQGTYISHWMLRSDDGVIFGLGPNGTAWFWVEIFAKE
jgi:hypothetical protein